MAYQKYTIVVSGEHLHFTRDQIASDPGNYFETYFFGGFVEGSQGARELIIEEKDIHLFKLIQHHLRGYEIVPLVDAAIPPYMSNDLALVNLLHEAQFYCLQGLVEKIQLVMLENEARNNLPKVPGPKYKFVVVSKISLQLPGSEFLTHQGWEKVGEWEIRDINEEMRKFHLNRLANLTHCQIIPDPFREEERIPGYEIEVAWREVMVNTPDTGYPLCVLLVTP
jgi:hypothetical protein